MYITVHVYKLLFVIQFHYSAESPPKIGALQDLNKTPEELSKAPETFWECIFHKKTSAFLRLIRVSL